MRRWHLTAGNRPGVCALPRYVAGRRNKSAPNYPEPERLRLEIPMFGKTKIAFFPEAGIARLVLTPDTITSTGLV